VSETWCITLGEERGLTTIENWWLRRIFGPKRKEMAEGYRTLRNDEVHKLYSSRNINRIVKSRNLRRKDHAASMGEMGNAYKILVGSRESKSLLGRHERIKLKVG
jgi:hypothetical protein